MADERIDIEVIDKVAKTIKPELLGISAAAKNAYTQIAKLKRELGVTGGAGMGASMKAVASAERDATRASAERGRQATATAAALDKERLATERLSAVAARAARSGVAPGSGANIGGRSGSKSLAAQQTEVMRQTVVAQDAVTKSTERASTAQKVFGNNINATGKQAALARHHLLNLGFQVQDIFVSLASGQKPLTVFIQQGGQIGQIAAQSGVGIGGMAKAIGSLLLRFAPLAIAVGGVAAGFALFNRQINKDNDIAAYAKSLGLTAKEMKKLDDVTVTFGDTLKAVFQVGIRNIAARIGIDVSGIAKTWNWFLDTLWTTTKRLLSTIYAAFAGLAYGVNNIIQSIGDGKSNDNPFLNVLVGYKEAYADAQQFFNDVSKQAGTNARGRVGAQAAAIKGDRGPGAKGGKSDAEREAERRKKAMDELDRDLKREAAMLARNLVGIDAVVAERMSSIEDSLDSVGIKLKDEGGNWTKYGQSIYDSVKANEEAKLSLAALQAQYAEASSVELDYAVNTEALNKLIEKGGPYLDNYKRQLNILTEGYLDATDPLRAFNRELDDQTSLLFKMGNARSITEYTKSIRDAYKARGESIYTANDNSDPNGIVVDGSRTLVPEVKAQVDAFAEYLKEQKLSDIVTDIFSSGATKDANAFLIENYKELYAAIDQMRTGDIASERQAAQAKAELNMRYTEARLEGTRAMFDQLASLQNSSVKELAAIGKAAAIAQATIDGVLAVQKALAQGGPLGIGLAVATGIAAAANVAKIAGIGFQKGGYTGDMPAHAAVGAVHGREFVFDAPATARLGVGNLEALRSGRLNPAPANDNRGAKVTVINNAGVDVQVRERSDGELEFMIDRRLQSKFGDTMRREMSQPNSKSSQAVGNNFKVRRNR